LGLTVDHQIAGKSVSGGSCEIVVVTSDIGSDGCTSGLKLFHDFVGSQNFFVHFEVLDCSLEKLISPVGFTDEIGRSIKG